MWQYVWLLIRNHAGTVRGGFSRLRNLGNILWLSLLSMLSQRLFVDRGIQSASMQASYQSLSTQQKRHRASSNGSPFTDIKHSSEKWQNFISSLRMTLHHSKYAWKGQEFCRSQYAAWQQWIFEDKINVKWLSHPISLHNVMKMDLLLWGKISWTGCRSSYALVICFYRRFIDYINVMLLNYCIHCCHLFYRLKSTYTTSQKLELLRFLRLLSLQRSPRLNWFDQNYSKNYCKKYCDTLLQFQMTFFSFNIF